MTDEKKKEAVSRWGITIRTVQNWTVKGEAVEAAPPLFADDPDELLEWYRVHFGKEPNGKLKARAVKLRQEEGLVAIPKIEIDLGPVKVIEKALARLGMDLTLARVIEEEERAAESYRVAREAGVNTNAARLQWKDASEMKRAAQKSDDSVKVAMELLREWVLKEWEPRERAKREALSGVNLGRDAREALLKTDTPRQWEKVWDEELEKALIAVNENE